MALSQLALLLGAAAAVCVARRQLPIMSTGDCQRRCYYAIPATPSRRREPWHSPIFASTSFLSPRTRKGTKFRERCEMKRICGDSTFTIDAASTHQLLQILCSICKTWITRASGSHAISTEISSPCSTCRSINSRTSRTRPSTKRQGRHTSRDRRREYSSTHLNLAVAVSCTDMQSCRESRWLDTFARARRSFLPHRRSYCRQIGLQSLLATGCHYNWCQEEYRLRIR